MTTATETRATSLVPTFVTVEAVYGQVYAEDGTYDTIIGWQLIAQMIALMTDHIDGRPRSGTECWGHGHVFSTREAAETCLERVVGNSLNPVHWDILTQDFRNSNDMQEEDMQLAMRERAGLPL